jgi:hypothetical protein
MKLTAVAVLVLMVSLGQMASGAIIRVPGDEPTIQAAVLATSVFDTVLVGSGTYYEHDIAIPGPEHDAITIASASGNPDSVSIDAQGLGRVFSFGPYVHLRALTLKNGHANYGGAVAGSFTATDCRFIDNTAVHLGGAAWGNPNVYSIRFERCEFRRNAAGYSGGAVEYSLSDVICEECLFVDNSAPRGGAICDPGGIKRGVNTLSDCTFLANTATDAGGALWLGIYAGVLANGCTFAQNEAPAGAILFGEELSGTSGSFEASILAFSEGGPFFGSPDESLDITTSTCVVFGNAGGDSLAGYHSDNLFVDPLFCGLGEGDLTLCANSPALHDANPWGVQVGAHGMGCGDCAHSPVEPVTWSAVKALYRR